MKHLFFIFAFLFASLLPLSAADNEGWKFYSSYFNTNKVEESASKVYVVAEGSLYSYGKEDNSIKQYTKGESINDMGISLIKYNKETKSLLIVYSNGNIDIMDENLNVTNLPYLYTNTSLQDKTINSVMLSKELAYISAGFGVMVVNMSKKEIAETYNLSVNTTSCAISGSSIYASTQTVTIVNDQKLTETSILKASLTDNLLDKTNWKPVSLFEEEQVSSLIQFKDRLYYLIKNKGVFYENNSTTTALLNNTTITTLKVTDDKLACIGTNQFYLFTDPGKSEQINAAIKDISTYQTNKYWIAEGNKGLRGIEKSSSGGYATNVEPILLEGPYMNSPYKIVCRNNKVYMVAGGRSTIGQRFNNPGVLMTYDYDKWQFVDRAMVADKLKVWPRDYTCIAVNPNDPEDVYVGSMGDGVIRFKNNEPVNWYNKNNSTIETGVAGSSQYQNIDGMTFDKEGNLWITNSEVTDGIKVLDKDGKWHSIHIPEFTTQYTVVNNILITSTNNKWINVPRVTPRVVVLDSGSSLDEANYEDFTSFTDQDKNIFDPNAFTCLAEDKDGYVWMGTSKGPVYFVNPDLAIKNRDQLRCTRVKLLKTEGESDAFFFLDNVRINSITVDEGNRKWLATNGSGLYVLDSDNQTVVHQFNKTNSPLPSDIIYSVAINNETGEVFIGTDKGLVSYRGEAISGKENYNDIYAYPNPVRPEFDDKVIITGLMDNSNIKITDINGNILYQTKSLGGQASWNCRNKSGSRVSTGIYLVLASTPEAGESVVTKIAVVK